MLLARAGHDVVLIDRARLPSDTTSTHSLVRGGVVQLARWGLLDDVLATGAPPIRSVSFHQHGADAPGPVRLRVKEKAGVDHMLAPRRHLLDRVLAEAATCAGAVLLDVTTVRDVFRDRAGRVIGVTTTGDDGTRRRLTARLVVGADGVRSRTARLVGAATTEKHAPTGACLYTYVGDVPWDGFEFHLGDGAFAGVFPTHFDEACVWLIRPAILAQPILGAGARRLHAWAQALHDTVPGLARRVASGTVTAPLRGAVGLPNHVRQAAGPGWALVGDAGYHRDPITGHGMTDAFRDAELLADAADRALGDPAQEAAALAAYGRERDAALTETFPAHPRPRRLPTRRPLRRAPGAAQPRARRRGPGPLGPPGAPPRRAGLLKSRSTTHTIAAPPRRRTPMPDTAERRLNGVDTDILFATIDTVRNQPQAAAFRFRAVNEWVSGTHSRCRFPGLFGAGQEHVRVVFEVDGDADAEPLASLVAQSQARSAVVDVVTHGTNVSVEVAGR
jgi:2-polyprenyl-6-methoxyphenol hydroxylase-like FAD-dependent oxidoreductase